MSGSRWPRGTRRWVVSLSGNGVSCYAMSATKKAAIHAIRAQGLRFQKAGYVRPDGNRIADGNGGWISQAELLIQ